MDLQQRCFSVKMYVKTTEMGPTGGRASENVVCRSANDMCTKYDVCLTLWLGGLYTDDVNANDDDAQSMIV